MKSFIILMRSVLLLTQLATYLILDARTPFFSEQRSFLRKTWRVSCCFRHEEAQANGFLCYKEATWVIIKRFEDTTK